MRFNLSRKPTESEPNAFHSTFEWKYELESSEPSPHEVAPRASSIHTDVSVITTPYRLLPGPADPTHSESNAPSNPVATETTGLRQGSARAGQSRESNSLSGLFRGREGVRRAAYVRYWLDDALERWWLDSEMPPLPLVRDGLLALEAGHTLDESQRSMLLRAALFYGRGVLTVLRYQTDGERTAYIIKEALLDPVAPLPVYWLRKMREEDPNGPKWMPYLVKELYHEVLLSVDPGRSLAAAALHELKNPEGLTDLNTDRVVRAAVLPRLYRHESGAIRRWQVLSVLTILIVSSVFFIRQRWRQSKMDFALVPSDTFPVSDPAHPGVERWVTLPAYRMEPDRSHKWCISTLLRTRRLSMAGCKRQ